MSINLAARWIDATEAQLSGGILSSDAEQAIVELFELVTDDPNGAAKVMLQIIEQEPGERILNCLGAGPMEELLIKHPRYLNSFLRSTHDLQLLKQCLAHVNADEGTTLEAELRGVARE